MTVCQHVSPAAKALRLCCKPPCLLALCKYPESIHDFAGPFSCAQVGGVPAVLKFLLQEGFIDGSCLTVTGVMLALLLTRHVSTPVPLPVAHCEKLVPNSYWYCVARWAALHT
jgi:hypothetical protein